MTKRPKKTRTKASKKVPTATHTTGRRRGSESIVQESLMVNPASGGESETTMDMKENHPPKRPPRRATKNILYVAHDSDTDPDDSDDNEDDSVAKPAKKKTKKTVLAKVNKMLKKTVQGKSTNETLPSSKTVPPSAQKVSSPAIRDITSTMWKPNQGDWRDSSAMDY